MLVRFEGHAASTRLRAGQQVGVPSAHQGTHTKNCSLLRTTTDNAGAAGGSEGEGDDSEGQEAGSSGDDEDEDGQPAEGRGFLEGGKADAFARAFSKIIHKAEGAGEGEEAPILAVRPLPLLSSFFLSLLGCMGLCCHAGHGQRQLSA